MRVRVWRENYLWNHFQRLECDWMTSGSTGRLEGSDLDYVGNVSKIHTERRDDVTVENYVATVLIRLPVGAVLVDDWSHLPGKLCPPDPF